MLALFNKTFKTSEDFKRHCNTKEKYPLKIFFCDDCGDFFACPDSLERHRRKPPAECLSVTCEKADEKRRDAEGPRVPGEVGDVLENR